MGKDVPSVVLPTPLWTKLVFFFCLISLAGGNFFFSSFLFYRIGSDARYQKGEVGILARITYLMLSGQEICDWTAAWTLFLRRLMDSDDDATPPHRGAEKKVVHCSRVVVASQGNPRLLRLS